MPSIPELVYAALLYKDGAAPANPESKDFVQGTATEDGKLIFSFQRPDDTSGKFTLEICAFVKTEGEAEDDTMQFSRGAALLSGNKTRLSIVGDTIEISEAIPLSSSKPGTVSLKIKVPDECSLFISEPNEDGTTIAENDAHFTVTGTSPNFTLTQAGEGISAGAYPVTFTVKKDDEIVHIFSEYINVINGLCTDTWWNGEKSSEVKDVANSIAKTVYVRGTGGYYDTNSPYNQDGNAMADDEHTGSFLSPLASIQKAIDKIIAINDGTSAYTIYVDGKFTQSTVASENGMVDFSALSQNLTLTIKTLSGTATLDANQNSRVIYAKPASGTLNLTLENIAIMGGNASNGSGGGIYFYSAGGTLKISDGTTISGNEASLYGGGVYINGTASMFTMNGGTISDCTATDQGGGVYIKSGGIFEMLGTAKITGCKTTSTSSSTAGGGGIYNLGALTMTGGTISDCISATDGGGVYVTGSASTFTMNGGTISGNTATANGGGVYVYAKNPKMSGGAISGNTASENGGGVYVNVTGTFTMKDGTISGNTANGNDAKKGGGGVYVVSGAFAMSDGTINGNTATNGNGAYLAAKGKLNMSGEAQFAESDDVYLYANGSDIPTVCVAGALTAASPVATITPSDYTAGRQVLSADGVTIDDAVCGKFAVSQKGWEIAPNDDGTAGVLGISIYLNSSSGDDANSGLTASKAVKTLTKAIELFESQSAQKIMVCAEYTLPSEESTLLDRAGKEHLTLMRYIGKSDVSGAFRGKLLTISQGNVTITNVTLDGTIIGYVTDELLSISGSGTEVTLGDDAIICNNSDSGVCVSSYNGKFKMTGGAITGNRTSFDGGGVRISKGEFEMSGGIISGNSGGYGGGVNVGTNSGCKFTMIGGEISGNYAKRGAGVTVSKGLYTGTFEMSGGTISGNQSYGTGDDVGGGGVYVYGKFTMSGGEISGNKAINGGTINGGGVFVIGTFKMEGGKIINNTAEYGGGVFVGGTFTMENGEITGNTASSGNGVYIMGDGNFTHTGGTVQED